MLLMMLLLMMMMMMMHVACVRLDMGHTMLQYCTAVSMHNYTPAVWNAKEKTLCHITLLGHTQLSGDT